MQTAIRRSADDYRARTSEAGPVCIERVTDRVRDFSVSREADPRIGRSIEVTGRTAGRALTDAERRLRRGQLPGRAAVKRNDVCQAIGAAVIPAVLLEGRDQVSRIARIGRNVRFDLGVRIVRTSLRDLLRDQLP